MTDPGALSNRFQAKRVCPAVESKPTLKMLYLSCKAGTTQQGVLFSHNLYLCCWNINGLVQWGQAGSALVRVSKFRQELISSAPFLE